MFVVGLLIVGGYLAGAVPFGLIVGRLKGVDVRTRGSGNIGATNVGRVLGAPYGLLVFALDLLKGLVPTLIGGLVLSRQDAAGGGDAVRHLLWVSIASACILGHMFPVYLRFRGGKGVATALGAVLGICPYFTYPGLVAFGLWILLTAGTRYVSVGSIGAAAAFPVVFGLFARTSDWGTTGELWPLYLMAVVIALLVIVRHRSNIRRLLQGAESRIGGSRGG